MAFSRKCDFCNVHVHRVSYIKHLRSKNYSKNELIIPKWLFKEPIEYNDKSVYNPNPLKQIARDNIKVDFKQLKKN